MTARPIMAVDIIISIVGVFVLFLKRCQCRFGCTAANQVSPNTFMKFHCLLFHCTELTFCRGLECGKYCSFCGNIIPSANYRMYFIFFLRWWLEGGWLYFYSTCQKNHWTTNSSKTTTLCSVTLCADLALKKHMFRCVLREGIFHSICKFSCGTLSTKDMVALLE